MAEGRSKRERGVTQDNGSSEARDRRKVADSNSLEEVDRTGEPKAR